MSEVMEKEAQSVAETAAAPEAAPAKVGKWKSMPRKKRRRIIRWCVTLVILAVIGGVLFKLFGGKKEAEKQVVTDYVQYGAIKSSACVRRHAAAPDVAAAEFAAVTLTSPTVNDCTCRICAPSGR